MLNRVLFGLAVASVLMLLAGGLNYIWRVVRGRSVGVRPTVLVLISTGLSLLDAAILEAVANSKCIYQPSSGGNTFAYLVLLRGSTIMSATASRHTR